jgi:hypothetical protein
MGIILTGYPHVYFRKGHVAAIKIPNAFFFQFVLDACDSETLVDIDFLPGIDFAFPIKLIGM